MSERARVSGLQGSTALPQRGVSRCLWRMSCLALGPVSRVRKKYWGACEALRGPFGCWGMPSDEPAGRGSVNAPDRGSEAVAMSGKPACLQMARDVAKGGPLLSRLQ